jgi:lipid II isoglutaminyl synthase (glutamine-hydrolysing)
VAHATCAGLRATDMANRLKYAGVDPGLVTVVEDLDAALTGALAALPAGETLYVLPTYTAMLDFRALLQRRGWVTGFWEQ